MFPTYGKERMTCEITETNKKGLFWPLGFQRNVGNSHNMNKLGKTFTSTLVTFMEYWLLDFGGWWKAREGKTLTFVLGLT